MIPELRIVARPRRSLESIDLGLTLLQAHRGPVMRVFLLQLGILLALILPFTWRQPAWSLLVIWWLTPWLHRGTLHVLSRRVFGQDAGVGTFLTEARSIHRRGLVASLLWRRFSFSGPFLLPIWQLEEQSGADFRSRARVLSRPVSGTPLLLAAAMFLLMALTLFGVLGLLHLLVPPGLHLDLWGALGNSFATPWFNRLFTLFGLVTLVVVEPFYVASAFALYLGARSGLEGWDLEQAFRRQAQRLRGALILLLLVLPLGATPVTSAPVTSASAPEDPHQPKQPLAPRDLARAQVEGVLIDPEIKQVKPVKSMHYRPSEKTPAWVRAIWDFFLGNSKPRPRGASTTRNWWGPMAGIAKFALVGALVALVLWLILRFHKIRLGRMRQISDYVPPDALAGLDIRPESLPEDVAGAALARFRQGDARGALALLYRATLAALVHAHRLEIPASATEGDCLRMALPTLSEPSAWVLKELTRSWVRVAYQGDAPGLETMESLCASWRTSFGGAR